MEPPLGTQRVVVVGGGVAGVTTAAELRKHGFGGPVTIIEADGFPHDRPGLTKAFLAGQSSQEDIALYSAAWFAEQHIVLETGSRAVEIDTEDLAVECRDGSRCGADVIVLATGGTARVPTGADTLGEAIHTIRTIGDALRLRPEMKAGRRLLVIGGGLLGAELAYTAKGLGLDVTVVEPADVPLESIVGRSLATWLLAHQDTQRIKQHTAEVVSLTSTTSGVRADLSDGTSHECDLVVAAVGFEPDTELAETAGLTVATGIVVDERQRTSDQRIYAIGDCAERHVAGRIHVGGHWEAAKLDGERAARSILGEAASPDVTPWFWTDRGELHLDVVGRVGECGVVLVRGEFGSAAFSVIGMNSGRVAAAACVNDPKSARQLRKLIDAKVECTPDELRDVSTDLRRLLKR